MLNYEITNFYELDFKDTSDKMENTDKKVQFWVQIYITLISSTIILFTSNIKGFMESSEHKFVVFAVLYLLGQILFFYVLASHTTHTEYVCKMNTIRCLILSSLGKNKDFIKNYGFTKCNSPKKLGMTYSIIYLELIGTLVFAWLTTMTIVETTKHSCLYILLLIVFVINIEVLIFHYRKTKLIANNLESQRIKLLTK